MSTLPLLFHRLIDDAALFPPGNAPMPEAVPAHERHRTQWYAPLVGPFLCPAARVSELSQHATAKLGVIVVASGPGDIEPAVQTVLADPQLELRGVEVPMRGEPLADSARRTLVALDAALVDADDPDQLPVYVEIPRAPGWRDALDQVAVAGYRSKLRTGGETAEAFPAEHEVAAFIIACREFDVRFKFTAGLHHAIRHTTSDGLEQHGFLNALAAVAEALDGADEAALAAILAERDAAAIAERVKAIPVGRAATVRTWFGSYGSCSIDEPLQELLDLGLVTKE
ncbi:MAG TPA: hypothetical protein VFZ85_08435 [Jiangellaceae bacterium]